MSEYFDYETKITITLMEPVTDRVIDPDSGTPKESLDAMFRTIKNQIEADGRKVTLKGMTIHQRTETICNVTFDLMIENLSQFSGFEDLNDIVEFIFIKHLIAYRSLDYTVTLDFISLHSTGAGGYYRVHNTHNATCKTTGTSRKINYEYHEEREPGVH